MLDTFLPDMKKVAEVLGCNVILVFGNGEVRIRYLDVYISSVLSLDIKSKGRSSFKYINIFKRSYDWERMYLLVDEHDR